MAERPKPREEEPHGGRLDKGDDDDTGHEILAESAITAHLKARQATKALSA